MKVYVAKHYWKDGKNAKWECHEKIDKKLFEYLKNNYHNFVINKPKMIKQDKQFIYLCYQDTKDHFGRNITEVTFFVLSREVENNFCKKKYKNLEFDVWNNRTVLWIFGALFLVVIMGISIVDQSSKVIKVEIEEQIGHDYIILIKDWNTQLITSNKKEFLLDEDNNTKVILKLNQIMKKFDVTFNENMNEDEIRQVLKKSTKEKSISDIVKKVLMMNDIEL